MSKCVLLACNTVTFVQDKYKYYSVSLSPGLTTFGAHDFTINADEWLTSERNDALNNARSLVDPAADGTIPTSKGAAYRTGPNSAAPPNAQDGQILRG